MHLHTVTFWLNDGLDEDALRTFEAGIDSLTRDPHVRAGYVGKPAATERDVVDNSYSYGMVLIFDDLEGHDQYQVGEIHQAFVTNHQTKWTRVVVKDIKTL